MSERKLILMFVCVCVNVRTTSEKYLEGTYEMKRHVEGATTVWNTRTVSGSV